MDMIDRIFKLIDSKGINDLTLVKELNLSNGVVGQWRKRKQKPSTDAIIKLSNYFNVSTDYFLKGDETKNRELSEDEKELFTLFSKLQPKERHKLLKKFQAMTEEADKETEQ